MKRLGVLPRNCPRAFPCEDFLIDVRLPFSTTVIKFAEYIHTNRVSTSFTDHSLLRSSLFPFIITRSVYIRFHLPLNPSNTTLVTPNFVTLYSAIKPTRLKLYLLPSEYFCTMKFRYVCDDLHDGNCDRDAFIVAFLPPLRSPWSSSFKSSSPTPLSTDTTCPLRFPIKPVLTPGHLPRPLPDRDTIAGTTNTNLGWSA